MPVKLYMDVHIPKAITKKLKVLGVDVITAQEDGQTLTPDDALLERVTELDRVIFTFDVGFKAMAEGWMGEGRQFGGLIFTRPMFITIGRCIEELQLIAEASNPDEWKNMVRVLPL